MLGGRSCAYLYSYLADPAKRWPTICNLREQHPRTKFNTWAMRRGYLLWTRSMPFGVSSMGLNVASFVIGKHAVYASTPRRVFAIDLNPMNVAAGCTMTLDGMASRYVRKRPLCSNRARNSERAMNSVALGAIPPAM